MINYDTELSTHFIVQFQTEEKFEIIWGTIEEDKLNRGFKKGDYVCSTLIRKYINDDYIKSQYTIYKVNNLLEKIELQLTEEIVRQLRAGVSPDLLKAFKDTNYKVIIE